MIQLSQKFLKCHPFVEKMEGGLTDDAADSGGLTNHGVSMVFLQDLAKRKPDVVRDCGVSLPVTRDTIRALTKDQAARLFYCEMWQPARCEDLPLPVAFCLYDMSVNHGRGGAVKICQRAANTRGHDLIVDGVIGPKTCAALEALNSPDGIGAIGAARRQYYENIVARRPSQAVFKRGWMRRADSMLATALGMLL